MEQKQTNGALGDLMRASLDKIHEMVDSNTVVGQPIITPDGITLIPISKVSFGFGSGGGDYGKNAGGTTNGVATASGAGVKIDPVSFLIIKDGVAKMLPVAAAPATTLDRVVEMVPGLVEKVEKYMQEKKEKETL